MAQKTLIIIGAGYAGSTAYHSLKGSFNTIIIEPKDHFENSPWMAPLAGCKEQEYNSLLPKVIFDYQSFIPQNDIVKGKAKKMSSKNVTFNCFNKDQVKKALSSHNLEFTLDDDETVTVSFDYCLICVGARYNNPIRWDSDNTDLYPNQEYSINTRLKEVRGNLDKSKNAVVVGGGYVALELAGYLAENNIQTTIAIRGKNIMNNKWFTEDMRKTAEGILKQKNIKV